MYQHILVPMALDHGIGEVTVEVARRLLADGGQITALHVYESPQGSVGAYVDASVVQAAFDRAQAQMEERVSGMPDVTAMIVKGHSGRTIIDMATQLQADCIVLGSHKPGLIDYFLGSTAARVVQHAPCAVHVARDPS